MPGAATGAMVEPSPIWEVKMDDPKRSKDREDEELEVDERDVSDIEVPEEDADAAKGGMMAEEKPSTSRGCRTGVGICR